MAKKKKENSLFMIHIHFTNAKKKKISQLTKEDEIKKRGQFFRTALSLNL